jgi:hypothetical protein
MTLFIVLWSSGGLIRRGLLVLGGHVGFGSVFSVVPSDLEFIVTVSRVWKNRAGKPKKSSERWCLCGTRRVLIGGRSEVSERGAAG